MRNTKKWIGCILIITMFMMLAACSSGDTGKAELNTGSNGSSTGSNASQDVSKPELGLKLQLTGEYAEAIVNDLDNAAVAEIVPGAIGGFTISKDINGTVVELSTVIVAPNEACNDSSVRGKFPYIYSGLQYSVLGSMESIDSAVADSTQASEIQRGIINQLTGINFNENVFTTNEDQNQVIETDNTVNEELNPEDSSENT